MGRLHSHNHAFLPRLRRPRPRDCLRCCPADQAQALRDFRVQGLRADQAQRHPLLRRGWYHVSQPDGKALEAYAFGGAEHLNVYELQRFDKGKAFEIIHAGHDKTPNCHTKPLTGKMPQLWDWVEKADYVRNFTANGSKFDLWGYKTAGITLEVAVPVGYPDILAYFGRFSAGNEFSYYIEQWKTDKPHSTWFEIPRECHLGPK